MYAKHITSSAAVGACRLSSTKLEVYMQCAAPRHDGSNPNQVNLPFWQMQLRGVLLCGMCACGGSEVELTGVLLAAVPASWSLHSVYASCTAQHMHSSIAQPECFACCRSEEIVVGIIWHVGKCASLPAVSVYSDIELADAGHGGAGEPAVAFGSFAKDKFAVVIFGPSAEERHCCCCLGAHFGGSGSRMMTGGGGGWKGGGMAPFVAGTFLARGGGTGGAAVVVACGLSLVTCNRSLHIWIPCTARHSWTLL